MNFKELCELVTAIDQTDIAELTLKNDEFELTLRKPSALQPEVVLSAAPSTTPAAPIEPAAPISPPAPISTPAEPTTPSTPAIDASLVEITSPMVGTFYRSPAPDESAFVEVGDRIQSGQTVCIIEAMKLMNELEAEVSGEIVAILVENAEPIEFGQPLMRVKLAK
ncbi:acetyl-CoA carboxylase biotin carboxyl carrier protein [Synechococcus sp. PCC 7335]|uniref:acetyl-CoA carboxylase biotin carboxyl carrier protein n=1 Tax=Synechococcus sp. (strain ATCC 29403 / PCC 7335) TaxID=91464 RepID=UPI0002E6E54C